MDNGLDAVKIKLGAISLKILYIIVQQKFLEKN